MNTKPLTVFELMIRGFLLELHRGFFFCCYCFILHFVLPYVLRLSQRLHVYRENRTKWNKLDLDAGRTLQSNFDTLHKRCQAYVRRYNPQVAAKLLIGWLLPKGNTEGSWLEEPGGGWSVFAGLWNPD